MNMARKTDTFFYLSKDGFSYIVPNTDVLSSALKNLSRREYVPVKLVVPFPPDTEANKFSVLSSEASKKFVNDITCLVNNTGKGLFPITTLRLPDCPYSYQKGLLLLTVYVIQVTRD